MQQQAFLSNHVTNRRSQRLSCRRIVRGCCGVGSAAALLRNIKINILRTAIKPVRFRGDSLIGEPAEDFKPVPTIGPGVEEIRVWDVTGAYRVIYTARLVDAVYVLHVFQKSTRATSRADIELAAQRFNVLVRARG